MMMSRRELLDETRQDEALREADREAERKDRHADHERRPGVAVFRVERPGALHQALCKREECDDDEQRAKTEVACQAPDGGERVEASEGERSRRPDPEALGKDEEAVEEVEGADGACDEERNFGIGLAEHAAHGGAEHEGNPEDCADLAEGGDALVRGRHVGDVGLRHHDVGTHHAADKSREQDEGQGLADGGHDHHDRKAENARKQHGRRPMRSERAPRMGAKKNCIRP